MGNVSIPHCCEQHAERKNDANFDYVLSILIKTRDVFVHSTLIFLGVMLLLLIGRRTFAVPQVFGERVAFAYARIDAYVRIEAFGVERDAADQTAGAHRNQNGV